MSGCAARNFATCGAESRSPPIPRKRSPAKAATSSSTIMLKTAPGRKPAPLTPSRITWRSSAGCSTSSTKTEVPPHSSALHRSRIEPSQCIGIDCACTTSGPNGSKSHASKSRAVPLCGSSTPLGKPVEPEVKNSTAGSSPATGTGVGWRPADPVSGSHCGSSQESSPMTSGPSTSDSSRRSRSRGQRTSRAAYPAPHLRMASRLATISTVRGSTTGTSCPGPIPRSCRAAA